MVSNCIKHIFPRYLTATEGPDRTLANHCQNTFIIHTIKCYTFRLSHHEYDSLASTRRMNPAPRAGRMSFTVPLFSFFSSTVQFRPAEEQTTALKTRESWSTAKVTIAIASKARSTAARYRSPITIATAANMVPTRAAFLQIIRAATLTATAGEFQTSAAFCRTIWSRGNKRAGKTTARATWYVQPNSLCRFACASVKPYSGT